MERVFKPLDKEEFKRRIENSFPSVYLTVISIIQGVALGILATNTFGYINDPHLAEHWIRFLPYSATSFIFIIVVSYEYTLFVGVLRWSPKIWDIVIPFVIGLLEVGPMFYLTNPPNWWLLTLVLCFFGIVAFLYKLLKCKQLMFGENIAAYHRTRKALKWDIAIACIAAFNCLLAGMFFSIKGWCLEMLFIIILIGCAVVMMGKEEIFMKNLHKDFTLTR